ncbi:hypothetical protein [Nocardioides daphniae]|uniref:Uncharacterized protein n=1 Tax=Nocardioides daphniae TaxID=402297 RepID=A0A4P7UBS1_9ACTN|nr:hypothetical protein [Nocardioides daphniae]QCC77184.1 hypothetical protein E2C04_08140 [Nocardioides daphniae]GGD27015.1 hypothetical protein GCM10007231_28070 [Nocardioides daphniae]
MTVGQAGERGRELVLAVGDELQVDGGGDLVEPHEQVVLGVDHSGESGPWDTAPVAEALERGVDALVARGYAATTCLLALDGNDDAEGRVTTALGAGTWDCVLIVGGLRKEDEQVALFERVVNLVKDQAPAARLAFNSTPHDLVDAVARALGAGQGRER